MCPGIWVGAASGRIYQSWCLTENWACVKGVCTSCAVLRATVTSGSPAAPPVPQCVTVSAFSTQLLPSWSQPAQSPDTTLLVVPCPQQVCWRRDRVVLKGDGSICISLYCFPNVWVLTPSVVRNSFPLSGFHYATHVWGGFRKALSQNACYTRSQSQFAGCLGSPLMGLILSMIEEGPFTDNLGNSVAKSCFIYYELNSVKYMLIFDCVLKLIYTWCFD